MKKLDEIINEVGSIREEIEALERRMITLARALETHDKGISDEIDKARGLLTQFKRATRDVY